MNKLNKRGIFAQIIITLLIIYIIIIGLVAVFNNIEGTPFSQSLGQAIDRVGENTITIFKPVFNVLFDLDKADEKSKFLIVITFLLMSTIIVGIMDAANIFDTEGSGKYINLIVGVIVSIIGVRFMPQDLWGSLAAPSSAFVATVLVGAPFLALALMTIKLKSTLASKALWLFYMVFMTYLIFRFSSGNAFIWIYIVFLALGALMLIFDSTARKFFYEEKGKLDLEKGLAGIGILERQKIRSQIEKLMGVISDPAAPPADVTKAEAEIEKLKARYPQLNI